MIRMLLVGYLLGIRSERRLCEEVHLNLAYRWFCRFGLEDAVPDHSTFSKNRHGRFRESDVFRCVFEDVVRACMAAGLVGGEGFAIDASVIEADASRNHRVEGKLMTLPDDDKEMRPLREYFDALDEAAVAETAKTADADDDAPPGNPPSEPKFTSLTNPAAAWTNKGQMKAVFAYPGSCLLRDDEGPGAASGEAPKSGGSRYVRTPLQCGGTLLHRHPDDLFQFRKSACHKGRHWAFLASPTMEVISGCSSCHPSDSDGLGGYKQLLAVEPIASPAPARQRRGV